MRDTSILMSVIIPTHNRSRMLVRAIESVLAQTETRFEILVIDDGSSDDTAEILHHINDPRIRHFRSEHAEGASRARNRGIAESQGRYVAFLDDDDEWLPGKLALQLQCFEAAAPNVALVHGGSTVVSERTGRVIHASVPKAGRTHYTDFLGEVTFTTSVVLIRRESLVQAGGFDEMLAGAQDRDLWIRLAKRHDFACVSEVLVKRYIHGDQITASLANKIVAKQQIIAKYHADLTRHPHHYAYQLWRLGILQCVAGNVAEGRTTLLRSIRREPSHWVAWRDLLTALTKPAAPCAAELTQRRLHNIDGILLYY